MKIKTLLCALAVAVALVTGNAMADGNSGGLLLNVTGTVKYQNLAGAYKGTVSTAPINEKIVYNLISNALANASSISTNAITSTNLPKGSYIVFDPEGYDGMVNGTFYAAYKVGKTNEVRIPLSGFDTNDSYYSFIELDSLIYYGNTNSLYNGEPLFLGFYLLNDYYLYYSVASYNLNKDGSGSNTSTSKALLYIHDNPYEYGDDVGGSSSTNYPVGYNNNALEIGGIQTSTLTIKTNSISSGSISLEGSGNFLLYNQTLFGVVSSGHAAFSHYTP